jgi:hypothetical protein
MSPNRHRVVSRDLHRMLVNNLPMPNQNLSDAEIRQYIMYFKWADAQPVGSLSSSGAGH